MLQSLELSGVKVVNNFSAFSRGSDKYVANLLLRKNGINVPPSIYIGKNYSRQLVARLFEEWKAVVVKPRDRWGGKEVIKFDTSEHFNDYYWAVQHICDHFYLEKFIPFESMDYRVEVIDGKRVGNPYSRQKGHSFITNIGPEGRGKPVLNTVDDEAVTLAIRAANIIGATATIVDMIRSLEDGELYVLEVNPCLGGFMGSFMSSDDRRAPVPKDNHLPVFIENDRLKLEAIAEYIKNSLAL
jgi:ribosomal protein S6--L-glutamate ligase